MSLTKVSAIAPNLEAANALAAPMIIPFMIFGGFFLRNLSTPWYFIWIKYLSWFYYGFNNFVIAQWRDGGFCKKVLPLGMLKCKKLIIKTFPRNS